MVCITWDEGGYIHLDMSENTCGVADGATVPDVTLDMSEAEALKAVAKREEMFLRPWMREAFSDSRLSVAHEAKVPHRRMCA